MKGGFGSSVFASAATTTLSPRVTLDSNQHENAIPSMTEALKGTDPMQGGFPRDLYLLVGMVACVGGAALLASLAYVAWRRTKRQKLQKSYEQFSEDGVLQPPVSRKASMRSNDPTLYVQNRTIDFVVPSIATALAPISSPPDAASLSSGSSPDIPLWAKLALLDNPSSSLGMPENDPENGRKGFTEDRVFGETSHLLYRHPARSPDSEISLSLLGGLNPELYKVENEEPLEEFCFPDGHRGRLWFGLEYDGTAERLMVNLVKVKNLPSRTYGSVNCCDPFVRISLMPDERRYLQSKLKKKNCNPKFDESFVFQVPVKTVEERSLKLTVLDNDRGKRHNVIGHVLFPLKELDLSSQEKYLLWRDLETEVEEIPSELGEIMVSLCYNQNLERLTLTVFEGKSLRLPEGANTLDTYVKVIFLLENKPVKSKKTVVAKRTRDPKYNESFNFRLAPGGLNSASFIIHVNTVGTNHKDKLLGRVVLGSYMFVRGRALDHWNEMISAGHKQVRRWHKLT